jgi:hypothetical protein
LRRISDYRVKEKKNLATLTAFISILAEIAAKCNG